MRLNFHTQFFKSMSRLRRRHTWWYKTYEFFKYDIWRFFRNIRKFRKELWNFYPWDYMYNLRLFKKSLELTCENTERYGNEVLESRNKKIAKMKRAIELLDNFGEDNFLEQAEKIIGREIIIGNWKFKPIDKDMFEMEPDSEETKKLNSEIYDLSRKIEMDQWKELWDIIHGQNSDDFKPTDPNDYEKTDEEYRKWDNGSGMKGWWD